MTLAYRTILGGLGEFDEIRSAASAEAVASQLPGRQNGGPADAYRHVLGAAGKYGDIILNSGAAAVSSEADSQCCGQVVQQR